MFILKKKIYSLIIFFIGLFIAVPSVNATIEKNLLPTSFASLDENGLNALSTKLSVTVEELKNLENNVELAMHHLEKQNAKNFNHANHQIVPVSKNLYLETSLEEETRSAMLRATYNRTITSTLKLKNLLGHTIVTLKGVGVFQTNGSSSKPIDAYGSYSGILWSLSSKSASKGATAYNSHVRVNFKGSLNIGISSVSVTIQSFNKSAIIYCNANGGYTHSWN